MGKGHKETIIVGNTMFFLHLKNKTDSIYNT